MLLVVAKLLHTLLYAGAAAGCILILYAGFRESRGHLAVARRAARLGGFIMAGSTLGTVASGPALLALLPSPTRHALLGGPDHAAVVLVLGASLTVVSGFIGLLAGLSGKPRPAGYFAAILFTLGVLSLLAAIQLAVPS